MSFADDHSRGHAFDFEALRAPRGVGVFPVPRMLMNWAMSDEIHVSLEVISNDYLKRI
jgi:hypothetical protein